MKHFLFYAFVLTGTGLVFSPTVQARPDTVGVPDSGIELGLGWDTQSAQTVPHRCIEFAPVQETGQTINLKITEVSDSSEVAESLNVSASMSVRSMVGSGSAQSEFASSSKVSTTTNSMMIRATVNNGVMFAGPPQPSELTRPAFPSNGTPVRDYQPWWRSWIGEDLSKEIVLTDAAKDVLGNGSAKNLKAFEKMCGDSFISAIYSGSELLALMSFQEKNTEMIKSTKSAIKASFSAWGASGEAEVVGGANGRSDVTSSEIEIDYTQIGGAGGIIPTSQAEFFEKLRDLPQETLRGPQFHTMDVTPYSDLPGWPQIIPLDTEDDPIDVVLTNYYWTLNSINRMIDDMLPEATDIPKTRLTMVQDKVTDFRKRIFSALREAYLTVERDTQTSYFWGLFTREDEEAVAAQQALQDKLTTLQSELVAFSLGRPNPNLMKLYLPLPDAAESVAGADVVAFYLSRQTKRICAANPLSPECLTNGELDKLAKCIPNSADWVAIPKECEF